MSQTIYLVQRITWETGWDKSFNSGEWRVSKPVRAFALRKEAEEWKAEAEARVRKELSPFQFANDLQYEDTEVTSLTQTEILNAIRELGLKAPKKRKRYGEKFYDWNAWWDEQVETMTEEQRADIWALFDRLQFYEIVESELEE